MQDIPKNSEINLWFEDDLFCQVNFWFVMSLLKNKKKNYQYFLIRPLKRHEYSFGSMSEKELSLAYTQKIELTDLDKLTQLWSL